LGAVEEFIFDPDTLLMILIPRGEWSEVALFNSIDTDFFGAGTGERRAPGPFADVAQGFRQRNIDPRQGRGGER
jgi:hypothetical protein